MAKKPSRKKVAEFEEFKDGIIPLEDIETNYFSGIGLNRHICKVLDEIKEIIAGRLDDEFTMFFIHSLCEEIRAAAQRMEGALETQKDFRLLQESMSKLKKEYRKLEKGYKDYFDLIKGDKDE